MEGPVGNSSIASHGGSLTPIVHRAICRPVSRITSHGAWLGENPTTYSLPLLLLQMLIISILIKTTNSLLRPLGIPKFVNDIVGAVILGPSVLGRITIFNMIFFPKRSWMLLDTAGMIGLMFFMFLVGVKMDPSIIKQFGKKAVNLGIWTLVLPIFLVPVVSAIMTGSTHNYPTIIILMSMSSFPVVASTLTDLQLLNTDMGRLAMSSAMASDVMTIFLATLTMSFTESTFDNHGWSAIFSFIILVFTIICIFRPTSMWIIKQTPANQAVADGHIFIIIVGVLLSALIGEIIGQRAFLGPLLLGIVIPDGPPLGSAIVQKFEAIVVEVLMPLYLASTGLRVNVSTVLQDRDVFYVLTSLLITCFIVKILFCILPSICLKLSMQNAFVFSLFMSSKGLVHIIVLNLWLDTKILNQQEFTIAVIVVVVLGAICAKVAAIIYKPEMCYIAYKWRTIQHTVDHNSEFRVLACVHDEEDVSILINLMQMSSPSKWNPLAVHVLHLVKLVGRASPLLVTHKPDQESSNSNVTDRVINAFRQFQQEHNGHVSLQPYTVMAPHSSMHMDVCSLALSNHVSLLVLPFHKHPSMGGKMLPLAAGGHDIQIVNQNVIENSPCSVGILVNRRSIGAQKDLKQRSYRVAVLFLGGRDDREALAYAARMASNSNVSLNVVRCVLPGIGQQAAGDIPLEMRLDNEMVEKFFIRVQGNERVSYQEEEVKNGVMTIGVIRSMGDMYDLFMVGRGSVTETALTAGLKEWNESSELGIIGDYLASTDYSGAATVLIVQQQAKVGSAYVISNKESSRSGKK